MVWSLLVLQSSKLHPFKKSPRGPPPLFSPSRRFFISSTWEVLSHIISRQLCVDLSFLRLMWGMLASLRIVCSFGLAYFISSPH